MVASYREPSSWWGPGVNWSPENALSITQLIENRMLDTPLASLLWLFVERKASLIVAAPPRLAGKTTLLSALMALCPPWYVLAYTNGQQEDFAFLSDTEPSKTYIMCNEISDHLPTYIYGDKVLTVFQAMERGYSLGATMHADSPQAIVAELQSPPISAPPGLVANLSLVVNLVAGYSGNGILRRVRDASLLAKTGNPQTPYAFQPIAAWNAQEDTFTLDRSREALGAIGSRLSLGNDLEGELRRHQSAIDDWMASGVRGFEEIKEKAIAFYGEIS